MKIAVRILVAIAVASSGAQAETGQFDALFSRKSFQVMAPYDAAFSPQGDMVATTVCNPEEDDAAATSGVGEKHEIGAVTENSPYLSDGCNVWIYPVSGADPIPLTDGEGSSWSPVWSPDGSRLVFHSDRGGDNHLWLWERDGGTLRRLSQTPTSQGNALELPVWTVDGKSVIAQLPRSGEGAAGVASGNAEGAPPGEGGEAGGKTKSTVTVHVSGGLAELQKGSKPQNNWARKRVDIGIFDVDTGVVRTIAQDVTGAMRKVSPDGKLLAYMVNLPANSGSAGISKIEYALVVLDLQNGRSRTVVDTLYQDAPASFSWSPDGRWLAYIDATRDETRRSTGEQVNVGDISAGGRLHVVSATGGNARMVPSGPETGFDSYAVAPAWDAAGQYIYLVGNDGALWRARAQNGVFEKLASGNDGDRFRQLVRRSGEDLIASDDGGKSIYLVYRNEKDFTSGLAKVDLAGRDVKTLVRDAMRIRAGFQLSQQSRDGRRIAFVTSSIDRPEDIWLLEGGSGQPRQLSRINPQISGIPAGKSRVIDFTSRDGKALRAAVLLPAGYEPGKRYPTVFWVYASDVNAASRVNEYGLVGVAAFNLQILAASGYAVVWPDIPVRVGTPVRDLLSAVSGAADRMVDIGITDPDRMAVMGQSNGGYSTIALLTQTDMFKLGIMNAGFGDLGAFYGTFDGGWHPWLEQGGGSMGVPPWEAPLRYIENSPFYYLDRVNTPLVIQAGTADAGIIFHSDAVWVGLKRLGKDVMYLRYEGEGHVLTSGANIRDYWSRVLPMLDKYVRDAVP